MGSLELNAVYLAELNDELDRLAASYGVTPTGIALAWITRHPANIQVVLGTTKPIASAKAPGLRYPANPRGMLQPNASPRQPPVAGCYRGPHPLNASRASDRVQTRGGPPHPGLSRRMGSILVRLPSVTPSSKMWSSSYCSNPTRWNSRRPSGCVGLGRPFCMTAWRGAAGSTHAPQRKRSTLDLRG